MKSRFCAAEGCNHIGLVHDRLTKKCTIYKCEGAGWIEPEENTHD